MISKFTLTVVLLTIVHVSQAKDVVFGMGNFEPYFIQSTKSGLFTELVDATFAQLPYDYPVYVFGLSNNVLKTQFTNKRLDAIANYFDSFQLPVCLSEPVLRFKDMAITRKQDKLIIDKVSDLSNLSVASFEGAKGFFGEEYTAAVSKTNYYEIADPALQATMLAGKRVDVSVGDVFIFISALERSDKSSFSAADFNYHPIFPETASRIGFHDPDLCQRFNKALEKVVQSGTYQRIYQKYLDKYQLPFSSPVAKNSK